MTTLNRRFYTPKILLTFVALCSVFCATRGYAQAQSLEILDISPIRASAFTATPLTIKSQCLGDPFGVKSIQLAQASLSLQLLGSLSDDSFGGACPSRRLQSLTLPALPPGIYDIKGFNVETGKYESTLKSLEVSESAPTIDVKSLAYWKKDATANPVSSRYLLTISASEAANLLALNGGTLWSIADKGFKAWPATDSAPPSVVSTCKFFVPATGSYFYSASLAECALLKTLPAVFTEEPATFRVLAAAGGACGFGTLPVYRAYSAAYKNHRYTPEVETYRAIQIDGWVGEGVAFCAPL
jgi:Repeat of unknown function (DUF5648)